MTKPRNTVHDIVDLLDQAQAYVASAASLLRDEPNSHADVQAVLAAESNVRIAANRVRGRLPERDKWEPAEA